MISIGVPGKFSRGELIMDPPNLGPGWVNFDFGAAFGVPVKLVNDAAMQALGSYRGGKMLFFGLGTGLGTALVINGVAGSMEIGQHPYKNVSLEDYVGAQALKRMGQETWRKHVDEIVMTVRSKIHADDVVLGGGNVKKLKKLPKGCRTGHNDNAFIGGFRLWEQSSDATAATSKVLKLVPRGKKAAAKPSHTGGFRSQSFRPANKRAAGHR